MNSLITNIPRLGEIKSKPQIGEIRLTIDGKRRKVFDGKCWQYLCLGDPNCQIQAKFKCRYHKNVISNPPVDESSSNTISRPKTGEIQVSSNGNRRIWRGTRWHGLCRADNCSVQAKDFCKTHQNERMSLPNTNEIISEKFRLSTRTRSCTLTGEKSENEASTSVQEKISFDIPTNKRHRPDENIFETVAGSPKDKPELHTRHGRRVRCNGLIWKHLCADKKTALYKRKYQRQNIPAKKSDLIIATDQNNSNQIESLASDTIDSSIQTSPITQMKDSKKRKAASGINKREHIVPKRKSKRQRQTDSDIPIILHLEPNSSCASVSDIQTKDQSIEEPILNESDITLTLKPNRLNTNYQSIEIPVQPPTPFDYDSSPSAILEQFGTIIKKEAVIEEESLICVPTNYINGIESPCETLQDFLRAEDMKKKEFKLDCQRISYRLAKIQDCIGSISSMTS